MSEKLWGQEPFWGLGYEWDPDWVLTDRQKELARRADRALRARAAGEREALRRRAELPATQLRAAGRERLSQPHRAGGVRGQGREPCRVLDGLRDARTLRLRVDGDVLRDAHRRGLDDHAAPHPELVDKYIRTLDSDCRIGTLSYSDPQTGSHFWYPFSSSAERTNGGFKVNKKSSWTTSGGFADFYVVQTTSPDFSGYDDLSVFVIDGDDVQAQPSLWDALGLRGNQSGPIQVEDVEVPGDQIVGPVGDGDGLQRRGRRSVVPGRLVVRDGTGSRSAPSTSPGATRPASATSTWACASPTTRRSRTTSAKR